MSQAFQMYDASKVDAKQIQIDSLFAASLKLSQLSDGKSYSAAHFRLCYATVFAPLGERILIL